MIMKKVIAAILVAFVLLITTNVAGASAAPKSSSVSVLQAAPQVSIPTAVAPPSEVALKGIGVGGIKPAWLYVSCYWAMNGYYYCWRYSCTYFEKVALGCYDGWYRVSTRIYV
ncbi:membrane protein [Arthrobacter phage Qui]|uniref:Membrane protein n=1 Tax=Arthrobacter phage Qui TaxID=2603260 RepID=A0A5B8WK69_9CAUD|nr:membrane protein [Arthrobacter phage Qui]QED11495.1 membrane protein [Arthrobacter phage Qui]QOC56326.1 membrane protein [Arthrobacter phage Paella]